MTTNATRACATLVPMIDLLRAIAARDEDEVARMLQASPALATSSIASGATRQEAAPYHLDQIGHYVYAGDTALHIAAAAYDTGLVPRLLALGADVGARNRRDGFTSRFNIRER